MTAPVPFPEAAVPSRIFCPDCRADYLYSPALLGRSYLCRQCGGRFTVSEPPAEQLPVAGFAPDEARELAPPPLPSRRSAERSRPINDEPDDRPRRRAVDRERSSGTGVLIGLVAAFVFGFLILAV